MVSSSHYVGGEKGEGPPLNVGCIVTRRGWSKMIRRKDCVQPPN